MRHLPSNTFRHPVNAFKKGRLIPKRAIKAPPVVPLLPEPPPAQAWTTHEAAETWLDQFTERTGLGTPLDWSPTATLAQKFAAALQLWTDWQDNQP